jgi:hypothetical protein
MRWLTRLLQYVGSAGACDAELEEALDRAAWRVEPQRLKQARGWPRRFCRPIATALAQARRVAQAIPGPVELDVSHYTCNPFIHALFGSAEDVRQLLRRSTALRDYARSGTNEDAYALLSLRREEKKTLGIEEHGGMLNRDALQRVIWFSDHRLIGPAPTLAQARDNLVWTLFDRFLERVAVGMERLRADKERLTHDRDLALSRLRRADSSRRAESRNCLDTVLRQLYETTESLDLAHLHEVFETVLSHPEDCLYLEEVRLTLDNMGVVRPNCREQGIATLTFTDLVERYSERRTVVIVHCGDIQQILRETHPSHDARWLL